MKRDQAALFQYGGILPLLAIMMIPLIGVIGLVIDTSLAVGARTDLETKTDQAALGAISHYVAFLRQPLSDCTNPPGPECCAASPYPAACAANQALARAQNIAGINFSLGERFTKNPTQRIDELGAVNQAQGGPEGKLEVGAYHWFKPCSGTTDECSPCEIHDLDYPCFVQGDPRSYENNALRVALKFNAGNKLQTIFMSLLGIQELGTKTTAIATLLPRNDYFLMDLSQSVYRSNYMEPGVKKLEPDGACPVNYWEGEWFGLRGCSQPGSRSEFAFRIGAPDEAAGGTAGHTIYPMPPELFNACTALEPNQFGSNHLDLVCPDSAGTEPGLCMINGPLNTPAGNVFDWGTIPVDPDDASSDGAHPSLHLNQTEWADHGHGTIPPYAHFREDYRCRVVSDIYDPADPVDGGDVFFMIDHQRPIGSDPAPGAGYFMRGPPQPLFDIIAAAHTGMQILKDRKLGADKFGFLGFDNKFYVPPAPTPTSKRHLRLDHINTADDSDFTKMLTALDITVAQNQENLATADDNDFISRGLFPFPAGRTDIHRALSQALGEIANVNNESYRISRNSIFIFTDGQANCIWSHTALGQFSFVSCGGSAQDMVGALSEIVDESEGSLLKQLQLRKISVSIALVGGGSGAHYVARKSSYAAHCMDQIEAAGLDHEKFADTTIDFGDVALAFPYTGYEDQLQEKFIAAMVDPTGSPFVAPNVLYRLAQATKGLWIPVMEPAPSGPFDSCLNAACAGLTGDAVAANLMCGSQEVTDSHGRVLYDPYGRSVGQQLEDAIRLALSSPFILAPTGTP